ncbi:MAG: Rv3235 family protein, partial [Stackebrandtia sp.]
VLRGRHPLTAMRRVASAAAFQQFSVLYGRLTRGSEPPVTLRLSRSDAGPGGTVDMVAIVQVGRRVRALSMRAARTTRSGWQLTLCQLVGRYLGP